MRHRVLFVTVTIVVAVLAAVAVLGGAGATAQEPDGPDASTDAVGTAFTYQGRLTDEAGAPLTGQHDFQFRLYDGSGSDAGQIGSAVTVHDEQVVDGRFTVALDFGANAFTGDARWLEIGVREGSSDGEFTQLLPSQELTPAPYAIGLAPGASILGPVTDDGALTLDNSAGDGLRVQTVGRHGVNVGTAGVHGVRVGQSGADGFRVDDAGTSGVFVESSGVDGLRVRSPGRYGLHVESAGDDGVVVGSAGGYGVFVGTSGNDGIRVDGAGHDGIAVYGAGNLAGYFDGDVHVEGLLSKAVGSFRIDHPQNPENMTLSHSFVESPEMMNVYNGNVHINDEGEAWVQLPDYFEALNRDFRYQLTPIGAPGPNLYIAEEIEDNRFKIAGGTPGMTVSWQVTGVRDDPYAQANPIVVEEEKPAHERGLYLHPEAYGLLPEMGISHARGENQ